MTAMEPYKHCGTVMIISLPIVFYINVPLRYRNKYMENVCGIKKINLISNFVVIALRI